MVRTKDQSGVKAVGAKADRKTPQAGTSSGNNGAASNSEKKQKRETGGNPVCPRPTPSWQKPITEFYKPAQETANEDPEPSSKQPRCVARKRTGYYGDANRKILTRSSKQNSTK